MNKDEIMRLADAYADEQRDWGNGSERTRIARAALEATLTEKPDRCKHGAWAADHCYQCKKDAKQEPWQPIETAPKDGRAVLVMRDIWPGTDTGRAEECNGHNTYVAAWWAGERDGAGAWICYMDAVQDPECPVEPTHWMPLPPAPGAARPATVNQQLLSTMEWLDRWMGHKPLHECADKVRAAIAAAKGKV